MLIWVFLLGFVAMGAASDPCGRVFSGIEGIISSPGFPNDYPPNQLCEMEIIAPPNHVIELEAVDFLLEACVYCACDYLDVRDIYLNNSRGSLGKYCGTNKFVVRSETNHMWILFKSDSGTTGYFRIFYRVIGSPNPRTFWCSNPIPYLPSSDAVEEERHESALLRNVQWLRASKREELPRTVLALYLADPAFFAPGNETGEELRDRLVSQLVSRTSRNATIRSQELALYVQALLVACEDPRHFLGRDLVSELRSRAVRATPFEVLALCNAGADVTLQDAEGLSEAFDSQHRPFWTDVQALAVIALQCLSSKGVAVDERTVRDMRDELKKRQFQNGTVENLATTGLVVQALNGDSSSFDLPTALEAILRAQGEDGSWGGSVRNSFYLLPALAGRSFLNISHAHCPKVTESERVLPESVGDDFFPVQYHIWVGSDVERGRFWKVKASNESSFYDVIEMVSKMDAHNVTYQVVDGKPHVRSLLGKEDDPELGLFWFAYVRPAGSTQPPTPLEPSPADVLVAPNQELIMWYKPNTWREERKKRSLRL